MFRVVEVNTERQGERFCALGGLAAPEAGLLPRPKADALILLENSLGRPVSRCGLWWNGTPIHGGVQIGAIGDYFAKDLSAGAQLLQFGCQRLKAQGCGLAVGPLDGTTWQRYRLITERGHEPPFFLEPDNPDDWPAHFVAAGFHAIARYHSSLVTDLSRRDALAEAAQGRFERDGGSLRALQLSHFDEELQLIYALSCACFRSNPFFTPLELEEFHALYSRLRDHLQPELILLAERRSEVVGMVFALPDVLQLARGKGIDTVVIKSLAVHPAAAGAGLGSLLVDRCHVIAKQLGYRRAIHALMHNANHSARISRRTASVFRRYALFGKRLEGGAE